LYDEDQINKNRDFIEEKIAVVILIIGIGLIGCLSSGLWFIFTLFDFNDPNFGIYRLVWIIVINVILVGMFGISLKVW